MIFLGYHGSDGPWKVTTLGATPILQEMFLNSSQELGMKVLRDLNSAEHIGTFGTFKIR